MKPFEDENIQIERVWCGERTGSKLVARHAISGLTAERIIGFDEESKHRRELAEELRRKLSAQYPPEQFIFDHMCGPQGASLCLRHVPTGVSVARHIGRASFSRYRREMMQELFQRLREHEAKGKSPSLSS
jgi:hypothetical protein